MRKIMLSMFVLLFSHIGINTHRLQARETDDLQFYSQAYQDRFVYTLVCKLLNKQDLGYYLEIGGHHPITINNTYFFEKNYGWKGVSIDISNEFKTTWYSERNNPLLIQDATQVDYSAVLVLFPRVIDYLSLDIDSNYDVVLRKIPFSNYIFRVITIEHDFYRYGDIYRSKEREILSSLGYRLLCADVAMNGHSFEDWWIHPSVFPPPILSRLESLDLNAKDYRQMEQILKSISVE